MSQALFVGREQELQIFQAFLQKEKPWVLCITGMGGCGKSTLLRHLATDIASDVPDIVLNFGNEHVRNDALSILENLALQLTPYASKGQASIFQEALQHGREELTWLHQQMEPVMFTRDRAHWHTLKESYERAAREVHQQVRARVTASFYDLVSTFHPHRLLMMFDTCEWLIEPRNMEVGRWLLNELIPEAHTRFQMIDRQCFVVIASRMQLPLQVVHRTEQLSIPLSMLSRDGVDHYLQSIGMSNAQLRKQVYTLTYGHPLCMSIIGGLWEERGEQSLDLSDFPTLEKEFNQQALLQFIQKRLDTHLASPFRELTHYGVLLRSFTLPLLQAVFPEFFAAGDALEIFHRLISYPYVGYLDNQQYAFHDLLREIQVAYIREHEPLMWQRYHERALDYLTQVAPYSPDWYYHRLACREEQTMSEWLQVGQVAQREQLEALLQAADDKTLKLTPLSQAKLAHQRGYFNYHEIRIDDALSSYQAALALYRQIGDRLGEANVLQAIGDAQQFRNERQAALVSYEQAFGLYQHVRDRLGEANVRKAIGDVQQFRDEREAALISYEQALGLFRQVGDRLGEANVRKAIGDVQQFRKEMQAALTSYEQALDLFRQVENCLGEANVLQAIGDVQQFRDEREEALALYEQALGLYQHVGSSVGEAKSLQAIGDVQQFRDEWEAALASYEQALGLYRQVGDRLGEANVLKAIGDVQQFRKEMQTALASYEQALALYRQVGDRLGEANALKAIGDVQCFYDTSAAMQSYEHAQALYQHIGSLLGEANCSFAEGQLAWIQDEYDTALEHYARAYRIYQQIDDAYSQARLLYYRSMVYEARDDRSEALKDMVKSMQLAERLDLPYAEFFQQRLDELQTTSENIGG